MAAAGRSSCRFISGSSLLQQPRNKFDIRLGGRQFNPGHWSPAIPRFAPRVSARRRGAGGGGGAVAGVAKHGGRSQERRKGEVLYSGLSARRAAASRYVRSQTRRAGGNSRAVRADLDERAGGANL